LLHHALGVVRNDGVVFYSKDGFTTLWAWFTMTVLFSIQEVL
jgi:3-mercaptopyruvate sulfurtransferase SseA